MARIARVVAPEFPHHIIQRGNRRQRVFFNQNDYVEYLSLLNPDFSLALKDGKSQKNLPGYPKGQATLGPAPIFLLLKAKEKLACACLCP